MKKFLFLALCIFLIPLQANARSKTLDIQEVTSPGGIKAWLVEDHSIPVIAMNFAFRSAGAINDPADKQGLSRMLSNTLDEGAGDIDSAHFQEELQDLSISLHFGSSRDDFTGAVKTLTQNKTRAFELLTLALTKPRFDEEPVGRMRAANQSRIRGSLADPDWIAARIINDVAFSGHPYAQNSGGTLSSLDKITPDDLRAFHKNYLGKNNLMVSVAGDLTKEQLAMVLDQVFGSMPEVKIPAEQAVVSLQGENTITVYKADIPQTVVEMLQPGISRKDPDYEIAKVMDFILGSSGFGSRLTEEIREKRGLTYGIYSSFMDMKYFDGFMVSTSTENKNAGEVIDLVKAEWKRIKDAPVSEKELQDAKNFLIGALPLSLTSTDDIAGLLLSMQLDDLPIDYLDQRETKIQNTTITDVQRIAQKILKEDQMTTVLVGQPEGVKDFKIIEKLPNVE